MIGRGARSLLVACCLLAATAAAMSAQTEEAREAAEAWLALVDAEDYARSWEDAATAFKATVTLKQWQAQMSAGRRQVGAVEQRKAAQAQAVTDPPGAPAGEYIQLRYDSTFSVLGHASEHVVLVRDGDRGWRIAGYFLRPPS
jgi:hypothetical protein